MGVKNFARIAGALGLGIGGIGVAAVGGLHALWAAGVTWPATTHVELAKKVVGSTDFPPPLACAFVAAPLLSTGAVALKRSYTTFSSSAPQQEDPRSLCSVSLRLLPIGVGAALLGRGIIGGVTACKVLGLPAPNQEFQHLDKTFYQPLCVTLGSSLIAGTALAKNRTLL